MKKQLVLFSFLVVLVGGGVFAANIKLTPPVINTWSIVVNGTPLAIPQATIDAVNGQVSSAFSTLETQLNTSYFSKLHDLTDLSRGFANSNSAAFDNASLMSFQTYDLFALMLGSNVGLALPSTDPNAVGTALNSITTKGDVYLGLGTGGFAGQFGLNTSSFLIKDLYLSAKVGVFPTVKYTSGTSDVSFQQGMFGLGVNYTLVQQADFLFGFIKWRGVSVGSGFTYNSNTTTVNTTIPDQTSNPVPVNLGAAGTQSFTASLTNIKAQLTVNDSTFVIPLEVMTSLQALWFLNVGLGAGLDVVFGGSQITAGGNSGVTMSGLNGASFTPGSARVTATDSKNMGDIFVPRLAASLGLDIAIFKLEVPMSYYPTTKAMAIGLSGGIVW